ncbi:MAG TPA: hypothetical protein VKD26_04570 [Streptosporangiaceae bacterium]|nr:hypothetical protein [Streptosporangiaceae bacterium]
MALALPGDPDVEDDAGDPVPLEEVVGDADDVPALDDPDVDGAVVELAEPVVLLALWVEPGSAKTIAPVASTPAAPTPAVTTANRLMPRLLVTSAVGGRSAGLTGIRFPSFAVGPRRRFGASAAVLHPRTCRVECSADSGVLLNCF